jgi:cysteinyl-tRNA synthetase
VCSSDLLTSHYRSPLNYDEEHLDQARAALTRYYTALRGLDANAAPAGGEALAGRFHQAMEDDFSTPEALAVLFDLVREINRVRAEDETAAAGLGARLRELGGMLGLLQDDPERFLQGQSRAGAGEELVPGLTAAAIEALIGQRTAARKGKDWAAADRIRKELQEAGILLEDGPQGTSWRRG